MQEHEQPNRSSVMMDHEVPATQQPSAQPAPNHTRKDALLREFLSRMDGYSPIDTDKLINCGNRRPIPVEDDITVYMQVEQRTCSNLTVPVDQIVSKNVQDIKAQIDELTSKQTESNTRTIEGSQVRSTLDR